MLFQVEVEVVEVVVEVEVVVVVVAVVVVVVVSHGICITTSCIRVRLGVIYLSEEDRCHGRARHFWRFAPA